MPRPIYGLFFLALALGGPYLYYETSVGSTVRGLFESKPASPEGDAANANAPWWGSGTGVANGVQGDSAAGVPGGHFTSTYTAQLPASGATGMASASGLSGPNGLANGAANSSGAENPFRYPPIRALQEVLRFDISPEWIPQRFPRVTTVLADTQLDGRRVPLVTGTSTSDLAGTLTYYFDRYKRVQRITVHAVAGDPSRFVAELQHAYQLEQQPTLRTGLYLKKWNGRATSVVYTAPAPVISADEPFARYQLFIELNQPGLEFGMSGEAQQLLATGQATRTWGR